MLNVLNEMERKKNYCKTKGNRLFTRIASSIRFHGKRRAALLQQAKVK